MYLVWFTNIWLMFMANVGKATINGFHRNAGRSGSLFIFRILPTTFQVNHIFNMSFSISSRRPLSDNGTFIWEPHFRLKNRINSI